MCTHAYRAALIRALSATAPPVPAAAEAAIESGPVTPPAPEVPAVPAELTAQH